MVCLPVDFARPLVTARRPRSRPSGCSGALHKNSQEIGREKRNVKRRRRWVPRKWLKRLAPRAGLEPATLRLTDANDVVSRGLRGVAERCRIAHRRGNPRIVGSVSVHRFAVCAVVCGQQRARKGRGLKRGHHTVSRAVPPLFALGLQRVERLLAVNQLDASG